MALSDISLTAGMRSNLVNLQQTVDLLSRTQTRLATGKKVNTALDNPTAFFAAQALDSRASDIDALKADMGQAIQTIQAADKGIKGISSLIEQARGIAQQAQSATAGTGFDSETITLNSVALGETIVISGTTLTAGPTAVVTSYDSFDLAFQGGDLLETGNQLVIGGVTYTASVGGTASGTTFIVGVSAAADANSLAATVTAHQAGLSITNDGNGNLNISITAGGDMTSSGVVLGAGSLGSEVAITSTTSTSAGPLGATEFARTGDDIIDAQALANLINNNATIHTTNGFTASASNGVITLTNSNADITAGQVVGTAITSGTMVEAAVSADTELAALQTSYNDIRTQIDTMATDSGYKGKNLLAAQTLTVKFEGTHSLDVVGFDASTTGLGITAATWTAGGNIGADVDLLSAALSTMRTNSSAMSSNLSIITTRQSFSTDMINVLTEGSGKLTLADTNEEGANMLMLQTRQSLSTTALSLASQAAQSVLRLFG